MPAKPKIALIGYFAADIVAEIAKRVPPGFDFEAVKDDSREELLHVIKDADFFIGFGEQGKDCKEDNQPHPPPSPKEKALTFRLAWVFVLLHFKFSIFHLVNPAIFIASNSIALSKGIFNSLDFTVDFFKNKGLFRISFA